MKIVESRTYTVINNLKEPVNCVFMNRWGCWDTLQLTRNVETAIKSAVSTFKRGTQIRVANSNASRLITYNSQYLNLNEYERYSDMLRVGVMYINNKLVIPASSSTFKKVNSEEFWVFELTVSFPDDEPIINF